MTSCGPASIRTRRTDNGRADRVTEHVLTRFLSRLVFPTMLAITLSILGYFGAQALSDIREVKETVGKVSGKFEVIELKLQHADRRQDNHVELFHDGEGR